MSGADQIELQRLDVRTALALRDEGVEFGMRVIRPPRVVATGIEVVELVEVVVGSDVAVHAEASTASNPNATVPRRFTGSLYAAARVGSGHRSACR